MSQNIVSKLAAVAIAVFMNGVILGAVCYLFNTHTAAAPTSAQSHTQSAHLRAIA